MSAWGNTSRRVSVCIRTANDSAGDGERGPSPASDKRREEQKDSPDWVRLLVTVELEARCCKCG